MATYAEGLNDRTVRVWDLESGGPTLAGHNSGVEALAFSERHGRPVIVSGGLDQSARLWDLESGHASLRIEVQHWVLSVAFTADRLVIGATTELLRVDLL
jgi:WD40 repeat protein